MGIGTTAPDVYSLGLTKQVTISTNGASVSSASIAIAGGTTGSARIDLGNESILRSAIQGINGSHLTLSTNAANSGTTLTERLRIQSDGNVGIGTTAPSTKFEVAGYTTISGSASHLGFNNPTTQQIFGPYGSTAAGGYSFNNDADTGFSRFAADTVGIVTGGSERLRVDSTGNVGIGTSAPGKTLEVAGNNTTSAYTPLRLRNTNGTIGVTWDFNLGTDKGLNLSSSSGNSSFSISPSSAALNAFYINNAGNVGIGTTGPNNNLHIIGASNTNSGIFVEDVAGSRILISGSRGTTGVPYIGTFSSSTPLTLGTNGNETMRLTTAGNVGIGTTAPTFNLDIQNATGTTLLRAKNTGSSNAGIILASDNNGGYITNNASLLTSEAIYFQNSTNLMRLYAAGAEKARLSSTGLQLFGTGSVLVVDGTGNSSFAGNVGIGTTAPGSKFEISGSNSDPSGALSNVGVVRIGTAATNGLDIGASSSSPFGVWLQSKTTSINASAVYPLLLNPVGGNVGIGTTNPGTTLDIVGTLRVSSSIVQGGAANNGIGGAQISGVQLALSTAGAARNALALRGSASQTADLQQWQDSAGDIAASMGQSLPAISANNFYSITPLKQRLPIMND